MDEDALTEAFLSACESRQTRDVKQLLKQHAWLANCRDQEGVTPLITAAQQGASPTLLKHLLQSGASIYEKDSLGRSALYAGITMLSLPAIEMLVQHGAMLDDETNNAETPTTATIVHGRTRVLKFLIEAGADANYACVDGGVPLYYAIYCHRANMVTFLLEHGAKVNSVHVAGFSLLEWAIMSKSLPILRSLCSSLENCRDGISEMMSVINSRNLEDKPRNVVMTVLKKHLD